MTCRKIYENKERIFRGELKERGKQKRVTVRCKGRGKKREEKPDKSHHGITQISSAVYAVRSGRTKTRVWPLNPILSSAYIPVCIKFNIQFHDLWPYSFLNIFKHFHNKY